MVELYPVIGVIWLLKVLLGDISSGRIKAWFGLSL
jgi:hypothetical protein